ncbi:hypothetical protein CDL12_05584 [Handroanthus impetiginosus]|uniref:Uncharacterized protein n=1 Tax=Handroanthus impetiginosus TaxID=429701 RepID=A0A2G9HWK7_9LAMI|nr:hypothetical protein CDL12_05584 [Handroanthus impetiginosus]
MVLRHPLSDLKCKIKGDFLRRGLKYQPFATTSLLNKVLHELESFILRISDQFASISLVVILHIVLVISSSGSGSTMDYSLAQRRFK